MNLIKLSLKTRLSPGDVLAFTAAVYSLHTKYPGEYQTELDTTAKEIWENNPHVTQFEIGDTDVQQAELHYPLIHKSNQRLVSFIDACTQGLAEVIGRPIELATNRPHLYLAEEEVQWMDQVQQYHNLDSKVPFWLVNAGVKKDFTCKQWPIEYYQHVVDETFGQIQWIQIGAKEHDHHPLSGVIDFRGKTSHRELIRLVYHSQGGLGPSTYLQHLCAAFEKPYLCLLGGREGLGWVTYPRQHTFHTIGTLDCCMHGGCFVSRVTKLDDNKEQNKSLCKYPVFGYLKPVPKCMSIIRPEEVISVLRRVA